MSYVKSCVGAPRDIVVAEKNRPCVMQVQASLQMSISLLYMCVIYKINVQNNTHIFNHQNLTLIFIWFLEREQTIMLSFYPLKF